jgi:hypothetical protein
MDTLKKFYRYERDRTSSFEKLDLIKFSLIKETPKGNWIHLDRSYGFKYKDIWVSNTSRKRYAHPTKKEALISYIYRTERRIKYLESDLSITNELLRQAKKLVE